jgi:uncharacterized SAM-binding protein YcdF (DUF218 family)
MSFIMKKETNKTEKGKSGKKKVLRFFLILILIIALVFGFTSVSIWRYSHKDQRQKADVIIVLGAALSSDGVSPVFRERLNHSITLSNEGYADKILVTGGIGEGSYLSDAYVAGMYLMEQGIPEEDILLEEESETTLSNLENAKTIMDENGFSSALIVSDPMHMKRAMLFAKDVGINAYSSPTPSTMYTSFESKLDFLLRESTIYIGYCFYRIFNNLF